MSQRWDEGAQHPSMWAPGCTGRLQRRDPVHASEDALWVCQDAFGALALLAAGVPRVVVIYGGQGWCWAWTRHVDALVFALEADAAGQQLTRPAALRGK